MTERFALGLNMGNRQDLESGGFGWAFSDIGVFAASDISNAPPVFNFSQIVTQLRTQWGGSYEGTYRAWSGSNVSYSIADYYPTNAPYVEADAYTMSAVMKSAARLGFELWDDAIAINLNESVNNPAANITMNWASRTQDPNGNVVTTGGTYAKTYFGAPSGGPIRSRQCKSG